VPRAQQDEARDLQLRGLLHQPLEPRQAWHGDGEREGRAGRRRRLARHDARAGSLEQLGARQAPAAVVQQQLRARLQAQHGQQVAARRLRQRHDGWRKVVDEAAGDVGHAGAPVSGRKGM
jgi:hypothetical protein